MSMTMVTQLAQAWSLITCNMAAEIAQFEWQSSWKKWQQLKFNVVIFPHHLILVSNEFMATNSHTEYFIRIRNEIQRFNNYARQNDFAVTVSSDVCLNSLWRLLVTGRDDFYQNSPKCCFILVILIMIKFPDENFITKFYLYYTCFRVECYFDILVFDTKKLWNIAICESSVFLLS